MERDKLIEYLKDRIGSLQEEPYDDYTYEYYQGKIAAFQEIFDILEEEK